MSGSIMTGISPNDGCFSRDRNTLSKPATRKLKISVLNDYIGNNPAARVLSISFGNAELVHERLSAKAAGALAELLTKPLPVFCSSDPVEILDDGDDAA